MSKQLVIKKCRNCKVETNDLKKGLCEVCREAETLHNKITETLTAQIHTPNIEKEILRNIKELMELSKESQWMQDKQIIIDTITSERLHQKTAWRLFVKLQSIKGQSQHLEEWEKETIHFLRDVMKFSMANIAFILDRSPATIHKHLGAND